MSRKKKGLADVAPAPRQKRFVGVAVIKCLGGTRKDQEITIEISGAVLGRPDTDSGFSPDIDLGAFDDSDPSVVSRKHAMFLWQKNELFIRDLNSTHGTFVNGKRIAPTAGEVWSDPQILKEGDKLAFADLEFEVVSIA